MVATLRWRDELKVEDLLKEEFPEDIFGKVGYVFGHDVDGRPITYVYFLSSVILLPHVLVLGRYNLYGGDLDIKSVFSDVQRFIRFVLRLSGVCIIPDNRTLDCRWRIQLMEKSIALLDFQTLDSMVQVHGKSSLP